MRLPPASAAAKLLISSSVVTSVAHSSSASASSASSGYQLASARPATKPRSTNCGMDGRGARDSNGELVQVRPVMDALNANRRERVLELFRPCRATGRDIAQAMGTEGRDVDGRGQRAQGLVRTDVARRLVAPDVLLSRAKCHHVRATALDVRGPTDEPARHLAHKVGAGGQ